jgi:hypothetical protein
VLGNVGQPQRVRCIGGEPPANEIIMDGWSKPFALAPSRLAEAEFERALISERTVTGLAAARARRTAFSRAPLARVPAARVRLNAMQASTSQAALAVKTPEGKCSSADAFMSAFRFSMAACWRWVLSASTVLRELVVKNAWKRNRSKRVPCPASTVLFGSGIRRTTRRPGTCSLFSFLDPNAPVKLLRQSE